MSENVTEITPQSIRADEETVVVEPEPKATYRVLQHIEDSGVNVWHEVAVHFVPAGGYKPDATDIGQAFGEGDYLLIETDSKYSHHWTYEMRVVADRRFREAMEDDE